VNEGEILKNVNSIFNQNLKINKMHYDNSIQAEHKDLMKITVSSKKAK
jgi:hypothetical protein